VDTHHDPISVVWIQGWQRLQAVGTKSIIGTLSGFTMQPLVAYFIQPLTGLTIAIGKVTKAAQRPEVLPNIPDATPFHLSFFPTRRGITYPGEKSKLVSKGQKPWIEANDSAIPLGNYGQHIIVQTFPRGSLHEPECMKMAAKECI
jgi:hypothetical protein